MSRDKLAGGCGGRVGRYIERHRDIETERQTDRPKGRTSSYQLRDVSVARHLALRDLLHGAVHGDEEGLGLVGSRHCGFFVKYDYACEYDYYAAEE